MATVIEPKNSLAIKAFYTFSTDAQQRSLPQNTSYLAAASCRLQFLSGVSPSSSLESWTEMNISKHIHAQDFMQQYTWN